MLPAFSRFHEIQSLQEFQRIRLYYMGVYVGFELQNEDLVSPLLPLTEIMTGKVDLPVRNKEQWWYVCQYVAINV